MFIFVVWPQYYTTTVSNHVQLIIRNFNQSGSNNWDFLNGGVYVIAEGVVYADKSGKTLQSGYKSSLLKVMFTLKVEE